MEIGEMYDVLDSFVPGFGKRDNPNTNNAVFIANELFNLGLSLKFRGTGRQGILSLKLYGMLEDVEPDPKKKPEAFNASRKLSVYNSHELMVMASYLWNEGGSALTEEEIEKARALLEKLNIETEEGEVKQSEAVASG